jgi:hypothetical protein
MLGIEREATQKVHGEFLIYFFVFISSLYTECWGRVLVGHHHTNSNQMWQEAERAHDEEFSQDNRRRSITFGFVRPNASQHVRT